jgi:protein tyrosine/serine phosphatase
VLSVAALTSAAIVAAGAWLLVPPGCTQPSRPGSVAESGSPLANPAARPAAWARRLELPGCPNLHKVSEDLYRGAQPTAEGMKQLNKLGVRTVVNLRSFNSDRPEMERAGVEFNYEHIWMKAWHAEDEEVVRFLKIVADPAKRPVFVHCKHGADRTGTMCAIYRVAVQGWTRQAALREMTAGGFGFHGLWQNLLRYVQDLDVDDLKRRAGMR